jgi:hypothetical protein
LTPIILAALLCAPATRTISGSFTTIFAPDDGSRTSIPTTLPDGFAVSAYWWNKKTNSYEIFPGSVDAAGNLSIPNVPTGKYFLAAPDLFSFTLIEFDTSTPDLSSIVSARPNLVQDDGSLVVTLNLTNNDPFTPGGIATVEEFQYQSSQAAIDQSPFQFSPTQRPVTGSTTFNGPMSWSFHFDQAGLPSAADGDVVWFHAGAHHDLGSGIATLGARITDKFAKLALTLQDDGSSPTVDVALMPTRRSGTIGGDVRYTQFAPLAAQSGPGAVFDGFFLDVLGLPHARRFPDSPDGSIRTIGLLSAPAARLLSLVKLNPDAGLPDTDYGPISYGEFLDSNWVKTRQTEASYTSNIIFPDGTQMPWSSLLIAAEPERGQAANDDLDARFPPGRTIAPVLGPVLSPRIAGNDAFVPQSGVGLTPVISWDPPALGTATSYRLEIFSADFSTSITVFVRAGTSFVVPPGMLTAGQQYFAVITSQSAPHDTLNAPAYRGGVPSYFTDCSTAGFTP